jgi:hypothetical protein
MVEVEKITHTIYNFGRSKVSTILFECNNLNNGSEILEFVKDQRDKEVGLISFMAWFEGDVLKLKMIHDNQTVEEISSTVFDIVSENFPTIVYSNSENICYKLLARLKMKYLLMENAEYTLEDK